MWFHAWAEGNWNEVKVSAYLVCPILTERADLISISNLRWKAYGQPNTGSKASLRCCLFGRCRRNFRYLFPIHDSIGCWPFQGVRSNYRWWLKSGTQHVLFHEESKVTWSYQKGKYYQQVDSPSTYTQDPSVICTQKGLKIWCRPERISIKSGVAVVPKLHISNPSNSGETQ